MKSLVDDLFVYTKMRQTDTLVVSDLRYRTNAGTVGCQFWTGGWEKGMAINIDMPDKPMRIEADGEKVGSSQFDHQR